MLELAEWYRTVLTLISVHSPAQYLLRSLILKRIEKRVTWFAQGLAESKLFSVFASPAKVVTSYLDRDLQGPALIKDVRTYRRTEMRVRHLNPKLQSLPSCHPTRNMS